MCVWAHVCLCAWLSVCVCACVCVCVCPLPSRQVLAHIGEKKAELEEEQKELGQYQALDTQRRAIEYVLVDHELVRVIFVLLALFVLW